MKEYIENFSEGFSRKSGQKICINNLMVHKAITRKVEKVLISSLWKDESNHL